MDRWMDASFLCEGLNAISPLHQTKGNNFAEVKMQSLASAGQNLFYPGEGKRVSKITFPSRGSLRTHRIQQIVLIMAGVRLYIRS
jgi:hypothetical protein